MFERKTWINRQSEHPARRRLTPTGNDNEYDVARAEGVIMEDGDAFDAETMNDLEKRVAEGFSTLDPADLGADVCVQVYACVKSGTVYELTGSGAVGRCKIPAAWNSGDTWSVNGKAVPAYCGADAVDSDCIVVGRWVLFTFDGQRLDFNGGGGLSSGKLAQATAAESDVLSGKKFYAGNKNLKTGTLALSGSAGTGDVLKGATFYKDNPKSKLTGTLALSGNANAAQVLSGYTFYKDNAKSKLTGTMANKGAVSATLNPGGSYTVPAGYHNGSGKVTGSYAGVSIFAVSYYNIWKTLFLNSTFCSANGSNGITISVAGSYIVNVTAEAVNYEKTAGVKKNGRWIIGPLGALNHQLTVSCAKGDVITCVAGTQGTMIVRHA